MYNSRTIVCNTDYHTDTGMCNIVSRRSSDEISLVYINIRSLVCNFDKLKNYIAQFDVKPDLIALAETKITEKVNQNPLVDIEGYTFIFRKSPDFFGGVGFYISNQLEYKIREDLDITKKGCNCQTLFIEISTKLKRKQVFGIVYRHPRIEYQLFAKEYVKILLQLANEKSNYYIAGDYNIDFLRLTKNRTAETFVDMIYSSGAYMPIDRATRVPIHTEKCCGNGRTNNKKRKKCKLGKGSLIDHVYLNDPHSVKQIGININDMTDHYPIFVVVQTDPSRVRREGVVLRRDYRNFDENIFNYEIKEQFDINDHEHLSNSERFELLQNSITRALDRTAPLRKLTKREKRMGYKPWFKREFKKRLKEKNHMYYLIQNRNKKELIPEYEILKRKLKKDIEKAEKDYYDNLFTKHKNDSKETWKLINNIVNRRKNKATLIKKIKNSCGDTVNDQIQICTIMNNHFVKNGPTLARSIPATNIGASSYLRDPVLESFVMASTNTKEIEGLIIKLKIGKASGPDGISSSTVKKGKIAIATILSRLINESIMEGTYPDCLKKAQVVPIHKKDSKQDLDNYRPISLVPCLAKIYEKVIYTRLSCFLKSKNVLSDKQFGFRSKHSTQHALSHLLDFLTEKIDASETSIAVFLDLSKAFETVNHSILLDKLQNYGIRGLPLKLMRSYLMGRKQRVKSGNHYSEYLDVICGIPQGSTLGPLLFILYINDLPFLANLSTILFADDTCVISSNSDLSILINDINQKLNRINQWFISNKLTVNFSKTNYMIFHGKCRQHFNGRIIMGNTTLKKVSSTKYLGLTIDDKLTWKCHITKLCSKISSCCSFMYKLRYYVPLQSRLYVYYSLFYSHITYGIICWGNALHGVLNPLRIYQNKIIKAMLFKSIFCNVKPLLVQTNLLNIKDLIKLEIAKHVYKFHANNLPTVFNTQYTPVSSVHNYRTRASARNDLAIARTSKDIGKQSMKVKGAEVWNEIPAKIRTLSNIKLFAKEYKAILISKYVN